MAQDAKLKIRGLYTFPNSLSEVPEGALTVADNVIIDRDSIIEPMRGFGYLRYSGGRANLSNPKTFKKIFFSSGNIYAVANANVLYDPDILYYLNSSTGWVSKGNLYPFDDIKEQEAKARNNLFLTTKYGVKKVSGASNLSDVGVPQAWDIISATPFANAAGWLPNGSSVKYRLTYIIIDSSGNELEGAPSQEIVATNSTGSAAFVSINNTGRSTKSATYVRLYRSIIYTSASPSDEMVLVWEGDYDTDTITDQNPSFTGASLYTNASQGGILTANNEIPKSKDIEYFKNSMFYVNTEVLAKTTFTVVAINSAAAPLNPDVLSPNDTITIEDFGELGGDDYTAVTEATTPTISQFRIYSSGISTSDNINKTLKSLRDAINETNRAKTLPAYWASFIPPTTTTGIGTLLVKRIEYINEKLTDSNDFQITTSKPNAFNPTMFGGIQSDNERNQNRVYWSKPDQPEAVSLQSYTSVGSEEFPIHKSESVRDSLLIFKDDGVFRLYGTGGNDWSVSLLDGTVDVIAPDTVVKLNNQVFCLSSQGVVAVTENGATIVSRPIEKDLLDLININPTSLMRESFAIAHETDRAYYLFIPSDSGDTTPTQYFRYNVLLNNWTRGTLDGLCGGVRPEDDLIYLALAGERFARVERDTGTNFDYANYVNTHLITNVSANTVTVSSSSGLQVGDSILQDSIVNSFDLSATITNGIIPKTAHGLKTGQQCFVSYTTDPFVEDKGYFISVINANSFYLCSTYELALAGTPINFSATWSNVTFTFDNTVKWATIMDIDFNELTLDKSIWFTLDYTDSQRAIEAKVRWAPTHFGNPFALKNTREINFHFLNEFYGSALATFESDVFQVLTSEPMMGSMAGGWGVFPFGDAYFGGILRRKTFRVSVPRNSRRNTILQIGFEHDVMFSPWKIEGLSVVGNLISERTGV